DRDGLGNPLPPIPVPDSTLGSPYENCGTSPTHWEFYHSTKLGARASDSGVYQTPPSRSIYMPMAPGHSHSPGSNSKVSPTPPKKPPRRNLSVSQLTSSQR
ncbi:hypothetical protein L9F63_027312, partial [Diploptera punctata]